MATRAPPRHRSAGKPAAAEAPVKRRQIAPGISFAGSLGESRVVSGGFSAATELKPDPLEIGLFERDQGERLLIYGRRERLVALR